MRSTEYRTKANLSKTILTIKLRTAPSHTMARGMVECIRFVDHRCHVQLFILFFNKNLKKSMYIKNVYLCRTENVTH